MGVAEQAAQGNAMSAAASTVIGLGRLVELIIRNAKGQRLRVTPQHEQWLAWKSDTRDLVVLRPGRGEGTLARRGDVRRHQKFHGAAPEQARPMEWSAPSGEVRMLGLIESATYTAAGIRSPSKGSHHWVHQFGDRGERGHGRVTPKASSSYSESLMPRLDVDSLGHLFINRRRRNSYFLRDWLIG